MLIECDMDWEKAFLDFWNQWGENNADLTDRLSEAEILRLEAAFRQAFNAGLSFESERTST